MLKEPNLASYPLLGLLHKEAQGCILYFCLPNLRSDKSNAESKHIYCSFISIHYQHDPPCETDAKPQFTFKILSFDTNSYNFAMTLILQDDHLTAGAWATCAQGSIDFLYSYDRNE